MQGRRAGVARGSGIAIGCLAEPPPPPRTTGSDGLSGSTPLTELARLRRFYAWAREERLRWAQELAVILGDHPAGLRLRALILAYMLTAVGARRCCGCAGGRRRPPLERPFHTPAPHYSRALRQVPPWKRCRLSSTTPTCQAPQLPKRAARCLGAKPFAHLLVRCTSRKCPVHNFGPARCDGVSLCQYHPSRASGSTVRSRVPATTVEPFRSDRSNLRGPGNNYGPGVCGGPVAAVCGWGRVGSVYKMGGPVVIVIRRREGRP